MTALQRALIALGTLALTIGAVVALTITGHDSTALLGWVIPIVTGAWAVKEVQASTQDQNAVLSRIDENVNGKLDGRIRDAVAAALADRGQ